MKTYSKKIVIIFFILSQTTFGQSIKNYRGLIMRGTPYSDITPKSEIKNGDFIPIRYYKAYFDSQDRLVKIEHYFRENISHQEMYGGNGYLTFGSPVVKIKYSQNKETREYFNSDGVQMRNSNGVFKDEFLYDDSGNRKSLVYYDSINVQIPNRRDVYKYEWETNEDKSKVVEKRVNKNGDLVTLSDFLDFNITHMTFKNGYRTAFINYGKKGVNEVLSEGRKISRTNVIWDEEHGNELIIEFLDLNGELKNLSETPTSGENGYGYAIEAYDWDFLGYSKVYRTLDSNRQLINRPNQNFAYQYFKVNKLGLTERIFNYDQGMNFAPMGRGELQVKFEYDKNGNRTEIIFLDEYDQPKNNSLGIAFMKYDFNPQNRLIKVEYLDAEKHLTEDSRGAALLKLSYDKNGKRSVVRFNKENVEIKTTMKGN